VRDEAHRLFAGYKNKEVLLVVGPVGRTIADTARKEDADLIRVSPSGRNDWKGRLLGSTSERLLRRAPCPVLVAR
jgi:nucleotide-binding universal stress UspA family protein